MNIYTVMSIKKKCRLFVVNNTKVYVRVADYIWISGLKQIQIIYLWSLIVYDIIIQIWLSVYVFIKESRKNEIDQIFCTVKYLSIA